MRLLFRLTPNVRPVPWDYQQNLSGWLYKQLGEDSELHEGTSLYSLSDLTHGNVRRGKLDFEGGSTFFLSSQRDDILIGLMTNLLKPSMPNSDRDPKRVAWGMYVESVDMQREPAFGDTASFWAKSPVLVRKRREDGTKVHVLFDEKEADELLTQTLHTKMERAGLAPKGSIRFDRSYAKAKSKLVTYKGVKSRASLCPVIVDGGPDVCAFAWNVGAGHSTGIGFGALEMMKTV
ncbi:MAG: CRISPR-associated endoribonuclease Cas6 [Saprospiraceae bacterium]